MPEGFHILLINQDLFINTKYKEIKLKFIYI